MELTCDSCGVTFTASRSDARYCSGKCRTDSYRARRDGPKLKPKRGPLRDDFDRPERELAKTVRRLEKLADDDRFSRFTRSDYGKMTGNLLRHYADRLAAVASKFPDPSQ